MYGIIKKFGNVLLFIFLLSFFSFIILKLAPGDPVMNILGTQELAATEQDVAQMREQLGLNKPIIIQYYDWLKKVIHLDLGNSIITGKSVISQIGKAFPYTFILALSCIIVMLIITIPLGVASAFYRNGIINKISELFNIIGSSIPGFWLGFILVDIFAIRLNLLPSMGIGGIKHIILPALTLGISMAPPYVRLLKTSLIESMDQDFIRAAHAKGVLKGRIFFFHILRRSLIPLLTLFGMSMGSLMGGTVVIEVLFSYPGLGKLAIESITNRDYPMIQGFILFIGMIVFIINLTVDILYRFIDPSIAIKEAEQVEV
ncbi:nickel ABC transporter permease [Clostridium tetanomorphum]|uniref:Nickel import system permease protein NikB n=1 Tax=Clostridium tetanomorphum TaxID=1553 RepID=A0A923IZD0_CLOTT|nr:nickel ABC transporter permease [Clostridium tetanomorphum]MBC2397226.1 ABC transporter permease [Clostridium tetanomorphum]